MDVFGWWEVAGELRENHGCTRRTCKLHIERPQLAFEPGTLFL